MSAHAFTEDAPTPRTVEAFPDLARFSPWVKLADVIDLLTYLRTHVAALPDDDEVPPYDRLAHFGDWIRPVKGNCLDTRQRIMVRDAEGEVQYRNDGCAVSGGRWTDPYSGQALKEVIEVHIDHVVPLNNAYGSGAYDWRPARRCHYANFTGNKFHLRAVYRTENMRKGARGPEHYIPPLKAFRCRYLSEWMKIKTIWQLTVRPEEIRALEKAVEEENCRANFLVIGRNELRDQRKLTQEPPERCEEFEKSLEHLAPPPETQKIEINLPSAS